MIKVLLGLLATVVAFLLCELIGFLIIPSIPFVFRAGIVLVGFVILAGALSLMKEIGGLILDAIQKKKRGT